MRGTSQTPARLDATIDALLREPSVPAAMQEEALTATARTLRDALPRLHPRFSFEELLAARLAAAGRVVDAAALPEPTPIRPTASGLEAVDHRHRVLLTSGAIASGVSLALPIAGAALVVWRRSRSSGGLP